MVADAVGHPDRCPFECLLVFGRVGQVEIFKQTVHAVLQIAAADKFRAWGAILDDARIAHRRTRAIDIRWRAAIRLAGNASGHDQKRHGER